MGWTSTFRAPGLSTEEFFRQEFPNTLAEGRVLASSCAGGNFYAAVRNDDGEVWCLVVLCKRSSGYFNFTYKEMDDRMGPNIDDCPAKILDLLTPTDSEFANDWRARCRAKVERKANRVKPEVGDTVLFAHPLTFSDGSEHDTFVYAGKVRRTDVFTAAGGRYNLGRDWAVREHVVIKPSLVPA
jgi:hypothetical protein